MFPGLVFFVGGYPVVPGHRQPTPKGVPSGGRRLDRVVTDPEVAIPGVGCTREIRTEARCFTPSPVPPDIQHYA